MNSISTTQIVEYFNFQLYKDSKSEDDFIFTVSQAVIDLETYFCHFNAIFLISLELAYNSVDWLSKKSLTVVLIVSWVPM